MSWSTVVSSLSLALRFSGHTLEVRPMCPREAQQMHNLCKSFANLCRFLMRPFSWRLERRPPLPFHDAKGCERSNGQLAPQAPTSTRLAVDSVLHACDGQGAVFSWSFLVTGLRYSSSSGACGLFIVLVLDFDVAQVPGGTANGQHECTRGIQEAS